MEIEKDVFVPMRDGVCMAVDIYRPGSPGRRPAVLIRTPYVKGTRTTAARAALGADGRPPLVLGSRAAAAATDATAAAVAAFVEAGHAVVVSDSRGTGYSEGVYDYYNLQGGPDDGYDTVEWVAEQPWCDGNVGLWGASGSGVLAFAAAVTAPPSLRAMVVNMHPLDFYHDQWFPGGVFRYEDRVRWITIMQDCISPLDPGDPSEAGYERKRLVYEQRYYRYYERMVAGSNPFNLDWGTEGLSHGSFDDFWKERSLARRIGDVVVPTLNAGVLHDHFIRGTVTSHEGLDVPRRLLLAPGALDQPGLAGDGGLGELTLRWFDHFLRGEENGVLDGPGARLYLTGAERWTDQDVWPVPAGERNLFLTGGGDGSAVSAYDGLLSPDPDDRAETSLLLHDPSAPNRTARDPMDQRSFEAGSLTFTTAMLDRDVAVVGQPRLKLFIAPEATDVDICVRLCDVYPDGSSRLLNVGSLKGSHFASHETPSDLEPGRSYELEVEILTVCNVFKAGHRVRLDVSASDFPFYAPNPVKSRTGVLHGGDHPSRLVLPIVEGL